MQNTNKEFQATLCVKTSQSELTELTKELFTWFDYKFIKVNTDYLIMGCIGYNYFNLLKDERVQFYDFFNNALTFFSETEKMLDQGKEITPEVFRATMHSNFEYNGKTAKKYCKRALYYFLEDIISDNNTTRSKVIQLIRFLKKYFNKAYKIACIEA